MISFHSSQLLKEIDPCLVFTYTQQTVEAAAVEEGTSAESDETIPEVIVHKSKSGITHKMTAMVCQSDIHTHTDRHTHAHV